MSEAGDRRLAAASGAQSSAGPGDDIAVELSEPEVAPTTSPDPSPAPSASSENVRRRGDTARRLRARMTLRIPDDEVSRPSVQSSKTEEAPPEAPPIQGTRIITINPPPPDPAPTQPAPREASGLKDLAKTTEGEAVDDWDVGPPSGDSTIVDTSRVSPAVLAGVPSPVIDEAPPEDAWAPAEPPLPDVTAPDLSVHDRSSPKAAASSPEVDSEPTPLEMAAAQAPAAADGAAAAADRAAADHAAADHAAADHAAADGEGRAQLGSAPDIIIEEDVPELPPVRARASSELDPDEVGLKSEPPPRPSEPGPGSESEISPEDVMSVESAPVPVKLRGAPPPPGSGKSLSSTGPNPAGPKIPSRPPPTPQIPRPPLLLVPGSASPLAPPPMNEAAAAARKRARPWWEDLFNDDFIRTMAKLTDAHIAAEADFIEESLGLAKGAAILDLACGTGRHAIELTRRGYQVVGFDLSLAMLARAADEAQEREQKLNFVQGDMREMTFEETFDGVYIWNTSFGFFEEEKNAAVITNVHRALKAGGLLLLDVANRDFVANQSPSLAWFEGEGCVCMDEMYIDWITSRMRVKRTMMLDDGRTKETDYSIRVYSLHELGKILHDHGFRVCEVSGRISTPGVFFGAHSPRILIVAEKR